MAGPLLHPSEKGFPTTSLIGFGLILGSDGKWFRLVELLDEAKSQSISDL
jgi:hypothetical protein